MVHLILKAIYFKKSHVILKELHFSSHFAANPTLHTQHKDCNSNHGADYNACYCTTG